MIQCNVCRGDGLVGAGDEPWLKQGAVETCTKCEGTGKMVDMGTPVSVDDAVPQSMPEDVVPE